MLVSVVMVAAGCGHRSVQPDRIVQSGYVSPDGKWSLAVTRKHGYGHLDITQRATRHVFRMYSSNDACCAQITWVRPHLLIFIDDYQTKTLDPVTKRVVTIAGFSNFVLSVDGRWVAGWADCGGHCAEAVDVVPITGGRCEQVPRRPNQDDNAVRFSRDGRSLTIQRRVFDVKNGAPLQSHWRVITIPLSRLRPVAICSGR